MIDTFLLVLATVSPIASAAYVVGKVRAELAGLRRDVDRHEREIQEMRHHAAL